MRVGEILRLEAILVHDLDILTVNMDLPTAWSRFKEDWFEEVSKFDHVDATILV